MSSLDARARCRRAALPAQGMPAAARAARRHRGRQLGEGTTDADGRCPGLTEGSSSSAGTYRLRFETGAWFARTGHPTFYPVVEIVFEVTDAAAHYHVPLLLSPVRLLDLPRELSADGLAEVLLIEGGVVATMDGARAEHAPGHVVVRAGRIEAVGPGPAPDPEPGEVVDRVDARGCLVTPGLVNTHHHLYQWVTRGLAVDAGLFGWLTTLYPVWGHLDEDITGAAAAAGLGWLARTGCTTSMDHHYVFPRHGGDVLGAEIDAARRIGVRFLATRGSMDLGESQGGLPPDDIVEDLDTILAASAAAIDTHHDPGPDSMLRIALAPCSPFSVTADLLVESAGWPGTVASGCTPTWPRPGTRTPTAASTSAARPWTTSSRWAGSATTSGSPTASTSTTTTSRALAASGTGVAHCPSSNARLGAGVCRLRDLRDAGGARRPRRRRRGQQRGQLAGGGGPPRAALRPRPRRTGGADASATRWRRRRSAARASSAGTTRSARWRSASRPTSPIWRLDTLPHADVVDPVAALVLGDRPPLELLLVSGRRGGRAGPAGDRGRGRADAGRGASAPAAPRPRRPDLTAPAAGA